MHHNGLSFYFDRSCCCDLSFGCIRDTSSRTSRLHEQGWYLVLKWWLERPLQPLLVLLPEMLPELICEVLGERCGYESCVQGWMVQHWEFLNDACGVYCPHAIVMLAVTMHYDCTLATNCYSIFVEMGSATMVTHDAN